MSTFFSPFESHSYCATSRVVGYCSPSSRLHSLALTRTKPVPTLRSQVTTLVGHPFLPCCITRERWIPPIEPRTTTAPIARPREILSPKPGKRLIDAPAWLHEDFEWDSKGNRVYSRGEWATDLEYKYGNSSLAIEDDGARRTDFRTCSTTSSSSPSPTDYTINYSPSPTSYCASDYDTAPNSPVPDTGIMLRALRLAEELLEIHEVLEDPYRKDNKEELLKEWKSIYAMVVLRSSDTPS
ncbi:hypothetical protein CPB84DRAFT_1824234 [Gymnopilus junonius]|uniref:Uncharacterized protein n=1 Tax=Gymnopilus junonius TaxID=109634 RepID=A0A9P5TN52_GYMJU|nr:hypothetical protein CPB84DRAFT_1824234 [Gymnopilus junonius]